MEQLYYRGGELQNTLASMATGYLETSAPLDVPHSWASSSAREYLVEGPQREPAFYELGQLMLDFGESYGQYPDTEGLASFEEIQMTRSLLGAIVQVLDGRRRILTIEPALSLEVRDAIKTRLRHGSSKMEPGRLAGIHAYKPSKTIIEACATVLRGHNAQAIVARLEKRRRAWECTLAQLVK